MVPFTYATSNRPVPQQYRAPVAQTSPNDVLITWEKLSRPYNPKFGDFARRARAPDARPAMIGWLPRPPPTPIDHFAQSRKPRDHQIRDEHVYRARVRSADIPFDIQRTDARHLLKRRTCVEAHVPVLVYPVYSVAPSFPFLNSNMLGFGMGEQGDSGRIRVSGSADVHIGGSSGEHTGITQ